jgi:hypothetical protein
MMLGIWFYYCFIIEGLLYILELLFSRWEFSSKTYFLPDYTFEFCYIFELAYRCELFYKPAMWELYYNFKFFSDDLDSFYIDELSMRADDGYYNFDSLC